MKKSEREKRYNLITYIFIVISLILVGVKINYG